MESTTSTGCETRARQRRRPPRRTRVRPRSRTAGRPRGSRSRPGWLARRLDERRKRKRARRTRRSYEALRRETLGLVSKREVEQLAWQCGFYRRSPREITAFDFALCCALAAMVEGKRAFASVWRLLEAAAGIEVARSAVTQRFGEGSARLMEELFCRATERLKLGPCPELLDRLEEFRAVLANDGSVVTLSPLLKKLFPATRTNSVEAAAKLHATADLVHRRIVRVVLTGEREGELEVVRSQPIEADTLYINDLGYTSYDYFAEVKAAEAHLLMRLKDNANPTIVAVRHGLHAPVRVVRERIGLRQCSFTKRHDSFDVDAEFKTSSGSVVLRVVGCYNPETDKYHCYVTTLGPDAFSPDELATLYSLRWVIELLFKLLKSSCHLDHVDTSDPDALRTHIYASLLAATILTTMCHAAAQVHQLPLCAISPLVAGIAAPLLVLPLLLLWFDRPLTPEELADCILRVLAVGCRDQNPSRTRDKWAPLSTAAHTSQ
ncbi:MAG: IS4 family transposase [Deltaproteobacteria bacterium]|nr:IS4 family transposase [Deltaproteobacteria bacterium]